MCKFDLHPSDPILLLKYSVVANGILIEESDLMDGIKLTHWRESVPIPVKVMTFGAARFAVKFEGKLIVFRSGRGFS